MYKKSSRKKELAKRTITYGLMTVCVLVVVSVVVLMVSGYRFDADKGQVEQSALVQFASIPSGGTVEVDGVAISTKTPTKTAVFAGTHEFVMWKEGYETWYKSLNTKAGSLVWLNYARLVPKERKAQTVASFTALHASSVSPTGRSILVQEDAAKPEFQRIDISGDTIKQATISLPDTSYSEAANPEVTHAFSLGSWDEDGRYILVEHTYADKKEVLVVDTRSNSAATNVTTTLTVAIDKAEFSGTSGNILYVLSDATIRKLDLSAGTISRALVTNVRDFHLFDTNALSYTSLPDAQTGARTVGVYREGDTEPYVLRTVNDADASLSIAAARYLSQDYAVLAEGAKVDVLKGSFSSLANGTTKLKNVASFTLDETVDALEFNDLYNYVFIRAGAHYGSYGVELGIHSQTTAQDGVRAADLHWLDSMNVYSTVDNSLSMREIDGANRHVLHTALSGQAVAISQNDKYLYSFQQTGETYGLQRIKMVL